MESLGDMMGTYKQLKVTMKVTSNSTLHTELHQFVEDTRKEWSDPLPFGRWLGACKNIPLTVLYQLRGKIRESNARTPAKLFFWELKKWKRRQKPETCLACDGEGERRTWVDGHMSVDECGRCNGTGKLAGVQSKAEVARGESIAPPAAPEDGGEPPSPSV